MCGAVVGVLVCVCVCVCNDSSATNDCTVDYIRRCFLVTVVCDLRGERARATKKIHNNNKKKKTHKQFVHKK